MPPRHAPNSPPTAAEGATIGRVLVGDRVYPADAPVLRADDRGFLYGDGVFETIRVVDGRPQHLERHLGRLRSALVDLRIAPLGDPPLVDRIDRLLTASTADRGEHGLRISVSRGVGAGPRPGPSEPTVVMTLRPLGPAFLRRRDGVRLRTVEGPLRTLSHLKSLCYLPAVLALGTVESDEEPLFVSPDAGVLEGATCNVFARFGTTLVTPAENVLPGITRGLLLERAARAGLDARAGHLTPADLARADALFATNALLPLAPVTALDGQPRAPDAMTGALRALLGDDEGPAGGRDA